MKTTYLGKFKMRPEQQTTTLENPHVHLANWCNNKVKHLNVIIMMRRTCSRLCNFNENVDKSIMKHLSLWWKERVPRQRIQK